MVVVPQNNPNVEAIYNGKEQNQRTGWREHLGASSIGKVCDRAIWYDFRWASAVRHNGRLLRIFERGKLEETRLVSELRSIGAQILDVNPDTGKQWSFRDDNGHFGGSADAIGLGFLGAPGSWHVIEFKTANAKSWSDLYARGVRLSKPEHWDQMQAYMHLSGIHRAIYFSVNKNDENIYEERIHYDPEHAQALMARAQRIIQAPVPPARIAHSSDFFICRTCEHREVCWSDALPYAHCRSCRFSKPVENGEWHCAHHQRVMDLAEQEEGCEAHEYI